MGRGRLQFSLWGKGAPSPVQIKGFPLCFGVTDQQGSSIPLLGAAEMLMASAKSKAGSGLWFQGVNLHL